MSAVTKGSTSCKAYCKLKMCAKFKNILFYVTNFKIVYWSRFFSGKRTTQIVFVTYKLLEYFKRSSAKLPTCQTEKPF